MALLPITDEPFPCLSNEPLPEIVPELNSVVFGPVAVTRFPALLKSDAMFTLPAAALSVCAPLNVMGTFSNCVLGELLTIPPAVSVSVLLFAL